MVGNCASTAGAQVQSLARKLRSHMPSSLAPKKTIGAQVKGTLQVPDVPASQVPSFLTLDKLLTFICEQACCRVGLRYDLWKVS